MTKQHSNDWMLGSHFKSSRWGSSPDPDLVSVFWENLDREQFTNICTMHELDFEAEFGFTRVQVDQAAPADFFLFRPGKGEGRKILAVAHLDTVVDHWERKCGFLETAGGEVVYSGSLDDRLGAYIILDLLPKIGLDFDVLLTVGEESGASTAQFFGGEKDHEYNWGIEFDRGGTDVVCYQYDCHDLTEMIEDTGARVERGIFSDISYLDHLGIKCMNWGVGYQDYHGTRSHAWLDDTAKMFAYFLDFHETNKDIALPHTKQAQDDWWGGYRGMGSGRGHSHDHGFDHEATACLLLDFDCEGDVTYDIEGDLLCSEHQAMLGTNAL